MEKQGTEGVRRGRGAAPLDLSPRLSLPIARGSSLPGWTPPRQVGRGAQGCLLAGAGQGVALSPHLHGEPRGDAHKSLTTATSWSPEAGQTLMSGPAVTDQASRRPCLQDQTDPPSVWTAP